MGRVDMVDKNSFIKNSLENELKDIYVTEDLKLKTLSRIKKEDNVVKPFKRKNRFLYKSMKGLALVSSILIMFFTFSFLKYNRFMNDNSPTIDNDNNGKNVVLDNKEKEEKLDNPKEKIDEKKEVKDTKNENIKEKDPNEGQPKKPKDNKIVNGGDNTPTNKEKTQPNKHIKNPKKENPKPSQGKEKPKLSEEQMLAKAENLWGGKINLPSYIPKGYDVTNIGMDTAYGSKVLKITYKNPNSGNFLELKVLEGDKTAFEDGNGSKNLKENEKNEDDNRQDNPKENVDKPTETVKSVNSNKNGVEYNIEGNIPAKTLEKIAESIEE